MVRFAPVVAALGLATVAQAGDLEQLAAKYKLDILTSELRLPVKTRHGEIAGKEADAAQLAAYTHLFVPEFALYPTQMVKRARLRRIILCRDLSFAGQLRTAIPDFENDTLYLDIVRGVENTSYVRKVIHHELFHIIDYRDDGVLYGDDRWVALTPPPFKYGRGGKFAQDISETATLTTKYPGFLNHYSTTGVEEDKAEVFANLIVDAEYVADRVKTDAVLRAKVERMKELLAEFCPDVDTTFWGEVDRRNRPVVTPIPADACRPCPPRWPRLHARFTRRR